ncbi:Glucose-methanol-choline oxidoreductase N-terminal [Penicillium cataractarum]|uniref:Glucose-methanol-choline oxidoreductase N-terminal n=1 Tax=Penicillium cataractarum TaxID=2100454 RepID=A0A9W9V4Y0_9EURO|nr:Glucose-methanol-choline oxidoreductase N-terminal [Penicillium cataractarum]KAJ5369098.1 Glucose-methanol-choline oxidoreductase N-terminal [Penicillium cataractarum]
MEAVGAASAILAIATAGVQCSVKLVTFAGQVKTAAEQITMVAEEVSLNASILQQLGELAKENVENEPPASDDNGNNTANNTVESVHDTKTTVSKQSIFNATGLETVTNLAKKCEEIFELLNQSLRKASKQLHANSGTSGKVKLSRTEMFKWPFLAPGMDTMRSELRNVKGTLMLMLQVATLAYSRRMMEEEDQELLVRSIVAAQKAQLGSPGKETSEAFNVRIPRQPSPSPSQIFASSPSRIFSIHLISPRASITNHQIHITYDARIIKLPDSTIESKLQEWKVSLNTTVMDQLAALNTNEYEALDATRNSSDRTMLQEETLEWIQFGDYHTLIQGIEYLKARTLTMIMSGVPQPTSRFQEEKKQGEEETRTTWIKVWWNSSGQCFNDR